MCVQNALQSSIRSNERVGCSSYAKAGWHWELRVGKLPEIGSLATDQRQHVTMQCTQREHEIPRAMLCLILLFLLWKTHVVLSIFSIWTSARNNWSVSMSARPCSVIATRFTR